MELPLFKDFTEEQYKQFGPAKKDHEVLETERHVYCCPFMYPNVEVGDFYEIDPDKGIEFKADDGFITIKSEKPIVEVNVVGSACTPGGYNIVEWWAEGESIDNMTNQLVKRQRIDGLNGTHPAIWTQLLIGHIKGLTFNDISDGDVTGPVDCLKKLSDGYYEGVFMGYYENTATFRIGEVDSYPNKITVRSGCKGVEDPGTSIARYPADYAIRIVELVVVK